MDPNPRELSIGSPENPQANEIRRQLLNAAFHNGIAKRIACPVNPQFSDWFNEAVDNLAKGFTLGNLAISASDVNDVMIAIYQTVTIEGRVKLEYFSNHAVVLRMLQGIYHSDSRYWYKQSTDPQHRYPPGTRLDLSDFKDYATRWEQSPYRSAVLAPPTQALLRPSPKDVATSAQPSRESNTVPRSFAADASQHRGTSRDDIRDKCRRVLIDIVAQYGHTVAEDHKRCNGLLQDYCGGPGAEICVLVDASRKGIPLELKRSWGSMPLGSILGRCVLRLCDDHGMAPHLARWSVETWALALGVATPDELVQGYVPDESTSGGPTSASKGANLTAGTDAKKSPNYFSAIWNKAHHRNEPTSPAAKAEAEIVPAEEGHTVDTDAMPFGIESSAEECRGPLQSTAGGKPASGSDAERERDVEILRRLPAQAKKLADVTRSQEAQRSIDKHRRKTAAKNARPPTANRKAQPAAPSEMFFEGNNITVSSWSYANAFTPADHVDTGIDKLKGLFDEVYIRGKPMPEDNDRMKSIIREHQIPLEVARPFVDAFRRRLASKRCEDLMPPGTPHQPTAGERTNHDDSIEGSGDTQ